MLQQTLQQLIASDLSEVNQLIIDRLSSDVVLINQMGHYIVNSGGKRMRPSLVVLAGGACGSVEKGTHLAAVIIEFIHTATLLHDDVVDESALRRGRETANAVWGNEASVLVGDFLYSRAFQMMVEIGNMRVMDILSSATNVIAEGEVMQLLNINDPDITEAQYLYVIRSKTAKLFEAATQIGAILANAPVHIEDALKDYGMHTGTAFQLIDDVLDYESSAEEMGKELGDDLDEGKPTLPLLYAIRKGNPAQREIIVNAIREGGREKIDQVLEIIHDTKAIEYARNVAEREVNLALDCLGALPESDYKEALMALAKLSISRTS